MNAAGRQVRPWLEKRGQPCDEREPWLWHVAHCTKGASQRQVPKAKSELTNCLYFGLCLIRLTASNDDEATMTPEDVRLRSELEERLQFVMLVADLSAKFIGIPASEIDHEINDALQQVCDCLGLDVGVLWQWELGMPETFVQGTTSCAVQNPAPGDGESRGDHLLWQGVRGTESPVPVVGQQGGTL